MPGLSKKAAFAHLAVIGANVIYGINYVVAKGIMPDFLQPRVIILLRVVAASLIFWLISFLLARQKVEKKDFLRLAACAFFGIAANQVLFFEGLNLTTPINASIIMVGTPILVLVFSQLILKDRLTFNSIIGITLGTAGASYLILKGGSFSLSSGTIVGNILVMANAASYGLFLVLVKPLMIKYHPITIMKWLFTIGLVYVIPLSVYLLDDTDFAAIPFNIWMAVVYVILFTTVLAYFLNNYSLKRISPTVNSAYIYLQPFLATVVALTVGTDKLGWSEVTAAALIFTGVYFVNRKGSQQKMKGNLLKHKTQENSTFD